METADDTLHNIPTAPLTNVHVDKEKASVVSESERKSMQLHSEAFLVRKVIIFVSTCIRSDFVSESVDSIMKLDVFQVQIHNEEP